MWILRGSGAYFFFMDIFLQSSLFRCNSAQSDHMRLVECSLEVEFYGFEDKIKCSENCQIWGSGAELLHISIIPQMSPFKCNSAQNNHWWLVLCSLEAVFF